MGKRTGRPRGRPPGAKNKRTVEVQAAMRTSAAKIEKALPEPFDGDAHALLMAVYKDMQQPLDLRLDAAKAAIRYETPALAAIDVKSENTTTHHVVSSEPLTTDEWEAEYGGDTSH